MTDEILPFPRSRGIEIASLQIAAMRHIVPLIFEADVTLPRSILKETSGADGRPLSFTAYIIACQARAMHANPLLQAYRIFPNRLIVFHEVDVATYVEHRSGGMVTLHVVRNADTRSVREISDEIRAAQADDHLWGRLEKAVAIVFKLPRFLQVLIFRGLTLNPHWLKQLYGTTQVSAFGMFGKHVEWAIGPLYGHTLGLWAGGINEKPMVHEGSIAIRKCLSLTVCIDHDIMDAEPVVKFISSFVDLLESATVLNGEAA
jgi:pyruvate/2-oxoglutarate dehydrogenase complex dihydrolipoamide acyltransferase (E2) component